MAARVKSGAFIAKQNRPPELLTRIVRGALPGGIHGAHQRLVAAEVLYLAGARVAHGPNRGFVRNQQLVGKYLVVRHLHEQLPNRRVFSGQPLF